MKHTHRRILTLGLAAMMAGSLLAQAGPALAGSDPHLLALPLASYPTGGVMANEHVDRSAAALTAESLFSSSYNQGEKYQRLGFRGSLVQKVRLPAFGGADRMLWLIATVFPTAGAAQQAFSQDGAFDRCAGRPTADLPLRYTTCGYVNAAGHEAGLYVVATAGPVEYNVLGFVSVASEPASRRAVRDALFLARQEAGHVLHLLRSGAVAPSAPSAPLQPTATPAAPSPTATPAPAATSVPRGGGNARCPSTLRNADWPNVNSRPDLYIGCAVDITGMMYHAQVISGAVSFNTQLNPTNGPDWTVFAIDYADTPPIIGDQTWVRIQGTIEAAASAQDSTTGAFTGYVPQVRVESITPISQQQAQQLGAQ